MHALWIVPNLPWSRLRLDFWYFLSSKLGNLRWFGWPLVLWLFSISFGTCAGVYCRHFSFYQALQNIIIWWSCINRFYIMYTIEVVMLICKVLDYIWHPWTCMPLKSFVGLCCLHSSLSFHLQQQFMDGLKKFPVQRTFLCPQQIHTVELRCLLLSFHWDIYNSVQCLFGLIPHSTFAAHYWRDMSWCLYLWLLLEDYFA